MRRIAFLALFGGVVATLPAADPVALKAAESLYSGILTETLPNGLRVYLKPVPGSPVVTTMMAYRVGSCDEDKDATGLSHYLEHLLFKGTDLLLPGDIDRLTQRAGGRNNAWTSEDCTVYHFDFAADQWEAGLKIEADRMRNTRIDAKHEFDKEKGAVAAELDRNEDQPYDLEQKAILPLLFGEKAPYGHPVIGVRQQVLDARAEVITAHYDRWYHPNNANLVVVGGFEPTAALTTIKKLFGTIPAAAKFPERKTYTPVPRTKVVRKEIPSKFEVPRMVMGFNGVRSGEADEYVLDVIQSVLGTGRTSRLYKHLVEGEAIASEASTANQAGRHPGWFSVQVELLQGKSREKAEALVVEEIRKLATEPVTPEELERVRRTLLANTLFKQESVHELCEAIARSVTISDLDYLKTYLTRVLAVTPADVQRVAKSLLDPERRVVVWSIPKPGGQGAERSTGGVQRRERAPATSGPALGNTRRVVLPNGLTLLLLENHRLPIISALASVHDVRLSEPADQAGVAQLVGMMLDEGTTQHSGPEIARLIENAGGDLAVTMNGGGVKVLAPDRPLGLSLLLECLKNANFPEDALERKRQQLLSAIAEAEQQPANRAKEAFQAAVYGSHPFGRPSYGKIPLVEKLSKAQCEAFYRQQFTPNRTTLAIVGDFDTNTVIAEIEKLTADWKSQRPALPTVPAITMPAAFHEQVISIPEAAQLYFYIGHPGIKRDDADYFKLLVMDNVLGTGAGFTDRLSSSLRDRQGLAYTVSANITNSASDQRGVFTGFIGTFPDKFTVVKEGFLREINRIRDETPTAQEVEDAKKYLLGSLPFHYTSNGSIADELLTIDRYSLGLDYLDKFRTAVAAVSPADVQAVAKKHLDPARMVLIVAGAVNAEGKPLAKPGKIE